MNYTEKYHLPQWEETDRVMREDFNQMCSDIETGITQVKSAADGAQKSADQAQLAAENAAAEAAKLPYVVGSYMGVIQETYQIRITVGFRPSFLIIASQTASETEGSMPFVLVASGYDSAGMIKFHDDGFTVIKKDRNGSDPKIHPRMANYGREYHYIAFQ